MPSGMRLAAEFPPPPGSWISSSSPPLQTEAATLLLLLLEAHPSNKRVVCASQGLAPFLRLASLTTDDDAGATLRTHLLRLAVRGWPG